MKSVEQAVLSEEVEKALHRCLNATVYMRYIIYSLYSPGHANYHNTVYTHALEVFIHVEVLFYAHVLQDWQNARFY